MTLLELLHRPPGETTAVVLPERGIRITYDSLRRQVAAAADVFASAGIGNAEHDWIAAAARLAVVILLPRSQVTFALRTTVFGDVHTVRKIRLMPNPLADDAPIMISN